MKPRFILAAALLPVTFFPPIFAQTTATLAPVVVTATRAAVPLTEVLADLSVVERDQIERSGAASVAEVLARLPGIAISQTGGPTSITGVFIRGAESRFTAVFVDGARIDSQSTGGASWEAIPLAQVERIEVLRGPAAAVYGSDAVAGVVHIFTREALQGVHPSVRMAAGSNSTRELSVSLRGGQADLSYSLGLSEEKSEGFDAQPSGTNHDRDGYRQSSFSARLGWRVKPGQKVELNVLANSQRAGYDGYLSAPPTNDVAKRNLQVAGFNWSSRWSDAWSTRLGMTNGTERYESSPSVYLTETKVTTYLFHNEVRLSSGIFTADLERREDELQNSSTLPSAFTKRSQNAMALGYGIRAGAHSLQVNARHDDDSEFGGKTTGALAYGYAISPTLRAIASTGTAFRAPTLFQRFSIYGSSGLKAESSINHEIGLRWLSGANRASLVTYNTDVDKLINYVSGPGSCVNGVGPWAGCYGNTGRARMTGTTFEGGTVLAKVNLGASVDWMDPRNLDTGKLLARRARQQIKLSADAPLADWQLAAELQYVAQRYDNASNTTGLAPYTLANASAAKQVGRDWKLQAKINNLNDKKYVLANGFATAGRMLYLGLTWAPDR